MTLGVANWPPKFDGILFSALGQIQGHKVQHLLVLGADRKVLFALTPSVKRLGLISTFAPIGILDLGSTLALTPSVAGLSVVTCNVESQMLASLRCQHNQQMKYIINEYFHSYLRTNFIPLVVISHYL